MNTKARAAKTTSSASASEMPAQARLRKPVPPNRHTPRKPMSMASPMLRFRTPFQTTMMAI